MQRMRRCSIHEQGTLTSQCFIKTDKAPMTALSAGHKSEVSLAISTAILAAPYTACQPSSLPRTVAPSLDVSLVLETAEPMERATAVDEATSDLGPFLDFNFCTSAGDRGFVVVVGFGLRKRDIMMRADRKIAAESTGIDLTSTTIDNARGYGA